MKKSKNNLIFCGSCGYQIDAVKDQARITKAFIADKLAKMMFLGAVCPKCASITEVSYRYLGSDAAAREYIKSLKVYQAPFQTLKVEKK